VEVDAVGLADAYLADVVDIYGIRSNALARLEREDTRPDRAEPDRLVRSPVTPLPDGSATVAYAQRHANLDVVGGGARGQSSSRTRCGSCRPGPAITMT
jgi:hypothetical protein